MTHLPPEARVLFLATRPGGADKSAALDELLASPLNWAAIRTMAEHQGLLPVLWASLRGHTARIPREVAELLRRQAVVTEFRMTVMEATLEALVRDLASVDIRAMLLKGAALAKTAYASFAERPMGDLDILVAAADARRAWDRTRAAGWTVYAEEALEFYETHHHLPRLIDPGGVHVELEIHRVLMHPRSPFALDDAEVWRDARTIYVGGAAALVPSESHLLLHLCVHFAWSHALTWGIGRTVRDVAKMLETGATDWASFIELARRTQTATCAYWTLAISRTLSGAKVPDDVLEQLRPRQPAAVTRALERAYVTSALFASCPSVRLGRMLWSAGVRPVASGHGAARPWHVGDAYAAAIEPDATPMPLARRLTSQLKDYGRWLRFAKVVSLPRSLV